MKKNKGSGKVQPERQTVKKKKRKAHVNTLERDYVEVFQYRPVPYQGFATDDDSLEQPSPLKDYPSTATPGAGVSFEVQPRPHAKLEPAIR